MMLCLFWTLTDMIKTLEKSSLNDVQLKKKKKQHASLALQEAARNRQTIPANCH